MQRLDYAATGEVMATSTPQPSSPEAKNQPVGVLQIRALLRGDLRQVKPLFQKARHTAAARIALRKCTVAGKYCRVMGRVAVENKGKMVLGRHVTILGTLVRCELLTHPEGLIEIGDQTFLNYGSSVSAHQHVRIGARCLIGQYVSIQDNNYHDIVNHRQLPPSRPVIIGDDVWIGRNAIILPGVTIGDGATVGAGAVVRSDVPAGAVVVGNPAQIVERPPSGRSRSSAE